MNIPNKIFLVEATLLVLFLSIASSQLLSDSMSLSHLPSNCVEAVRFAGSNAKSDIYQIRLPLKGWEDRPFYVYCLLDHKGGDPWLLIQRRQDENIDFYRNWNDYKTGFGNMEKSFWIGLDKLHALTQVQLNELQIELRDFNDTVKYANYETFAMGDGTEKYALNILGKYSGSAGDSFLYHSGQKFSTYDQDNDNWGENCAEKYKGAWWFNSCHYSELNGEYLKGTHKAYGKGIGWGAWHGPYYSLKYTHMAIRPRDSAKIGV
ncbi:ryncolin-1-like [Zeugodacus cucurbitae]|uniref:ryncolin-1-like n=1 Tax=Zeugodacus cucurbitae TaxID=28588 RepID=UPI0023D96CF6|nr:ryncolin-1-like [Zeugodacus cucurbitae]